MSSAPKTPETVETIYHRLRRLRREAQIILVDTGDAYTIGLRDGLDLAVIELSKIAGTT